MEQAGLPDTTAPRIKRKNLRNEKLDISSFMERAGIPSLADRIPAPLLCFKSILPERGTALPAPLRNCAHYSNGFNSPVYTPEGNPVRSLSLPTVPYRAQFGQRHRVQPLQE